MSTDHSLGFGIQALALLKARSISRWQGIAFLLGVLMIGTPDGVEIVNLTAAILMTVALVPYGFGLIRDAGQRVGAGA